MKLLCFYHEDCRFTRLIEDLRREGVVPCTEIHELEERLGEGDFEGMIVTWHSFTRLWRESENREPWTRDIPLLAILDDVPAESECAMALQVIAQGGDDNLVGSRATAEMVVDRLRLATVRRKYENASIGIATPGQHPTTRRVLSDRAPTAARISADGWKVEENPLHVLHITCDPTTSRRVGNWLSDHASETVTIGRISEAKDQLKSGLFDVVLLDGDSSGEPIAKSLQSLSLHAGTAATVVTFARPAWQDMESAVAAGAQDCVSKTSWNKDELWRKLCCSVARQQRRFIAPQKEDSRNPSLAVPFDMPASERRAAPRYIFTKPMVVIPILPDGSPNGPFHGEAISSDLSESGLGFEVAEPHRIPGRHLLVGIEGDDGVYYYATVEVCNQQPLDGRIRMGVRFVPPDEDLLRWDNLLPTFQPSNYRLATRLSEEMLRRWVDLGVLEPFLADRPLLCPRCRALPTYRRGCKHCGSIHLANRRLIHHFPCAYVGFAEDYDHDGEIICPKCRVRNLVVGADFEYLQGPFHCTDCGWTDTELETVGYCPACHWRFTLQQAQQEELIGYHVNRLDPLALLGPT